jgi:multicomponent Na+:H+ antiporter subunit G
MFQIIGWGLILLGLATIFSGIIGLFRLPDFYSKLHASGVIECCGIPLSLIGLACLQHSFTCSFKLILAAILILLLSPVSTNLLGKAALLQRLPSFYKIEDRKKRKKDV